MLTRIVFVALIAIQGTYSQPSQSHTMIGCENSTLSLSCPIGSYVSIIRANYGRFSISVCNHQARQDIDTNCNSQENSTAKLRKMCNKLNFCQVPVHSYVLQPVCPETPKYLEAQYRCEPNNAMSEKVRQTRLPRFQGNISDVWSNRNKVLNIENVEVAIDKVIANHKVPITEKPSSMVKSSETSDRYVDAENVNITHSLTTNLFVHKKKRLNNSARLRNKNTTTVPLLLTKSSLIDKSSEDE